RAAPRPAPEAAAEEEPGFDPFVHAPPFRPRRNPARLWTWLAAGAGLAMLAAVAAISHYGLPQVDFGSAAAAPDGASPLVIEQRRPERRRLESGNDILTISGRIVNPTRREQTVPDLEVELLDAQQRSVYGWTISAPTEKLQPDESVTYNSTMLDIPRSADNLQIGFAADRR
ncbi:MAG: FxLYD domain-containing protein, partial [Sphingomonadaceae bacterium]